MQQKTWLGNKLQTTHFVSKTQAIIMKNIYKNKFHAAILNSIGILI